MYRENCNYTLQTRMPLVDECPSVLVNTVPYSSVLASGHTQRDVAKVEK